MAVVFHSLNVVTLLILPMIMDFLLFEYSLEFGFSVILFYSLGLNVNAAVFLPKIYAEKCCE